MVVNPFVFALGRTFFFGSATFKFGFAAACGGVQEFYRVENEMTRTTQGTGIGLSMVKKLCTLSNMKIEIENANPGLRTKIHFPPLSI